MNWPGWIVIEITPPQVTPEIRMLFDRSMPTAIRCFAVLGGGNAGRIFIDDLEHPQVAYAWERDDGTLYQGGRKDQQKLHYMVEMLRKDSTVALTFRDGDAHVSLFPPEPDAGAECVELDRPVGASDLTQFLALPPGYTVHRMGRALLEKSPRLEETLFRYGDLDTYINRGLDLCILRGSESVGEAGADMEVDGVREVGVVTEHAYRGGHGFGTLLVAHLLKWTDELGVATYWDCVRLNLGSLKIARKLGFRNERSYKILAWFPRNRKVGLEGST
jgi:RimJ/RimL family protein N-acetyltransferase